MSLVKNFEGTDLDDIENQINSWVKENGKTKQDPTNGRVIAGKRTHITQTETLYFEKKQKPFSVLITFELA